MTTPAVTAWSEHDEALALHAVDRSAIGATEAARSLVLELFDAGVPARDLFNACARLGALLADSGASPSLVAGTIDNAARALSDRGAPFDAARLPAARASLVEGYVAAVRAAVRAAELAAWEYPACVVFLGDDAVAIACGYPADDSEALGAWAARVAGQLARAKVRRATLSGSRGAIAEIASALELVGIAIADGAARDGQSAHAAPTTAKSWLRLPWRR